MKFSPRRIKVGLELTSKCNLRCGMCPLPVLRRPYEDMEWWLVERAEREIHGAGLRLKLPAFVQQGSCWILPAFSPWAAGAAWNADTQSQIWLCAPKRILRLPQIEAAAS